MLLDGLEALRIDFFKLAIVIFRDRFQIFGFTPREAATGIHVGIGRIVEEPATDAWTVRHADKFRLKQVPFAGGRIDARIMFNGSFAIYFF
ncbi:hypothetical protein D3C76_1416140 [compost metagenome]